MPTRRHLNRQLEHLLAVVERLSQRIDDIDLRITKIETETSGLRHIVAQDSSAIAGEVEAARRGLFDIRRAMAANAGQSSSQLGMEKRVQATPRTPLIESAYAAIESKLRGSRQEIIERQRGHLHVISQIESDLPVVDLGCGRGEFISLLMEEGIEAVGVEESAVFVSECRDRGLVVQQDDLLRYLRSQPDGSFRAVVLLQVIEHLPFEALLQTFAEARRVLVPGGVLLGETPNGANLAVGGSTFWLDHTHVQPLHPELLQVLAEFFGFERIHIDFLNPPEVPWELAPDEVESLVSDAVVGLQSYVLSGQDVLLVAHRPAFD